MNLAFSTVSINSLLYELVLLRHSSTRFLFATASVLTGLAVSATTQLIFGSTATLVFAVTVVICTALLGLTAGLCAVILAILALDFFYIPPSFEFNMDASTLRIGVELGILAVGSHFAERRIFAKFRRPKESIQGVLDGTQDGQVYGWAFDPDHPFTPVFLTLLVNHRPMTCVAAINYRPDLAEAMLGKGNCGFTADLGSLFPAATEALVDVRLPNGTSLANAPRTLKISAYARPKGPTVLFMHIPKTAGTAFREAIAANYKHFEIAYLYPTLPGFLVDDLRLLPMEQRRCYRMIIGHFQFGMHEALPQESQYITVVREPTARVLSHYAYLQQTQPDLVTEGGGVLPLKSFLEQRLTVDFDNAMVRFFSGVGQRAFPPGALSRDVFDLAVYNLRTAFTFVGHQETSTASFAWLRNHFGWHAKAGLEVANPGKRQSPFEKEPGLLKSIRHYNHWDYLFYEEILRTFPQT
jgi:hypothetical protein